jgi:hypothetical protein
VRKDSDDCEYVVRCRQKHALWSHSLSHHFSGYDRC